MGRPFSRVIMEKSIKKYFALFALPALICFLISFVIPFIWGFVLSFCEFTTITDVTFVGFKNYVRAFTVNIMTNSGSHNEKNENHPVRAAKAF